MEVTGSRRMEVTAAADGGAAQVRGYVARGDIGPMEVTARRMADAESGGAVVETVGVVVSRRVATGWLYDPFRAAFAG
jgi:hypothetical protein